MRPLFVGVLIAMMQLSAAAHALEADAHADGEPCAVCGVLQASDDALPGTQTPEFGFCAYSAALSTAGTYPTPAHRVQLLSIRAPPYSPL